MIGRGSFILRIQHTFCEAPDTKPVANDTFYRKWKTDFD